MYCSEYIHFWDILNPVLSIRLCNSPSTHIHLDIHRLT